MPTQSYRTQIVVSCNTVFCSCHRDAWYIFFESCNSAQNHHVEPTIGVFQSARASTTGRRTTRERPGTTAARTSARAMTPPVADTPATTSKEI